MIEGNDKLRIEIPDVPPAELSLNYNRRAHWSVVSNARKDWKALVRIYAIQAKWAYEEKTGVRWQPPHKALVQLTLVYKGRRKRDQTNLHVMWKPGEDVLVEENIVTDDDIVHLVLMPPKVVIDKEKAPMTIVEVSDCCTLIVSCSAATEVKDEEKTSS